MGLVLLVLWPLSPEETSSVSHFSVSDLYILEITHFFAQEVQAGIT